MTPGTSTRYMGMATPGRSLPILGSTGNPSIRARTRTRRRPPRRPRRRGFGKVWCTQTDVRSKLGKALGDEKGYDRTVQDFQGGSMVLIPEYSDAPLVLLKDSGRWQLLK